LIKSHVQVSFVIANDARPGVTVIASDNASVIDGADAFHSAMLISGFQRNSLPR
jgi:hypothetical protein